MIESIKKDCDVHKYLIIRYNRLLIDNYYLTFEDYKITNDSTIQKERFNNLGLKRFKVIKYEQIFDSSIKDKFLNYAKINRYISMIYFNLYKLISFFISSSFSCLSSS